MNNNGLLNNTIYLLLLLTGSCNVQKREIAQLRTSCY